MDHYLGKVLNGRYEIIEIIGTGGMAVVYKALDSKLNRMVAVKVLKPELRSDTELRRRFHAESEAVARLSHPNIINVFDVSTDDEIDFFVMELIDGITLKQYMNQRGALSPKEALHFTIQILRGLEHAHTRKIVHRDIKPQNIMILRDGTAKVTDFGIARIAGSSEMTVDQANAFGSVHYIAPEQARCEATDGRADIYSVGVMLYEMLTGQLPYQGDNAVAVAMQHIRSTPVPPRVVNEEIPEALEAITLHAMSGSLETRYSTAGEMIDDLEAYRKDPANFMPDFSAVPAEPYSGGDTVRFTAVNGKEQSAELPRTEPKKTESAKQPAKEKKKFNLMPVLAAILLLLLVSAVVAALWVTILSDDTDAEDVSVPRLIGRTYQDVATDPTLDFELVVIGQRHDSTYPEGYIIDQDQLIGKTVKEGSTIGLTLSLGKRMESMPNYINWDYTDANKDIRALMEKTVTVTYMYETSDTVARNSIIRTIPISNQPITEGDEIVFVISQGGKADTVPMPYLLGMTEEQARSTILSNGLTIGIIDYSPTDTTEPGRVLIQSTPNGAEVPHGMAVNLTISKAIETRPPETTTEPTTTTTETTEPPTEPTTESSEETTEPTEPPPESTDPSTEPSTEPTQQSTEPPTEPPTQSTEPSSEPITIIPSTASTEPTTEPVPAGVDWTLLLPQGAEYPEQFYLEITADGEVVYASNVEKSAGSVTVHIEGSGTVQVEVLIDSTLYKSEAIVLS